MAEGSRNSPIQNQQNSLSSNPEGRLAEEMREGSTEALAEAFECCRSRLEYIASFRLHGILKGRISPADAVQDAYLAAADRLSHYSQKKELSPFLWLRMILCQTITDLHRHHLGAKKRDAFRERPAAGIGKSFTSTSLAISLVSPATSPSNAAARAEMTSLVEGAVAAMDEVDQEIIALRHFEQLANSEISAVLAISQKAASIRYVRALKSLREVLSQWPGLLETFGNE
ncbi:MAG: sigma-70 family RNA polymerase sigma factor [Planctomycetota bacterium]